MLGIFFFKKDLYWDEFLPMHTQHYIDGTGDMGICYHIVIDNVSLFVTWKSSLMLGTTISEKSNYEQISSHAH